MDIYSSKLSKAVDLGIGAYLIVLAILSTVGNILVLVMAARRSRQMKPPELLSVNLALTDLGAAVSMYPLAAAAAWNHGWIGGDVACRYYGFAGFFFGVASMATLTVMAVVRFIVSTNLQSPKDRVTRRNVSFLMASIWVYALLWALFPLLGWGAYGPEPFGLSCTLAWSNLQQLPNGVSFVLAMFSMNLAVPSVTIIACYAGIALRLRSTLKAIDSKHVPSTIKMQRRLILIAMLISCGFLASWTPYGMVSLWSVYRESGSIPPLVSMLPCLFAKTSTVYNPLIYYAFSKTFKAQVQQLCCRACPGASGRHTKGARNTVYLETEYCSPRLPPLQPRGGCADGKAVGGDGGSEGQQETQLNTQLNTERQ
ncbi:opsin 8, group member b [Engraulis encrasicolus]|uniref:opsin 8, group member b n=1 Tax=Engraulis encrasicolus TaxID=184585 RepID=UPI002FD29136